MSESDDGAGQPIGGEVLVDLNNLFGIERVNHGDPEEDFVWKWPKAQGVAPEGATDEPITLHLADGSVTLMAQHVWQSALTLAEEMYFGRIDVKDKIVVELGAGAALPSIVACKLGAKHVVVSDYPEDEIVENMKRNVNENLKGSEKNCVVEGYKWGTPTSTLTTTIKDKIDYIIMADTLWLNDQHHNLLASCRELFDTNENLEIILTFMNHDDGQGIAQRFFDAAVKEYNMKVATKRTIPWMRSDGQLQEEEDSDDPDVYGPVYLRILKSN